MQIPDTRPGFYYVTARKGDQYRRLRGPFVNDHAGALAAVDAAMRRACDLDPRGHWYSYGTAWSPEDLGPGIFDSGTFAGTDAPGTAPGSLTNQTVRELMQSELDLA